MWKHLAADFCTALALMIALVGGLCMMGGIWLIREDQVDAVGRGGVGYMGMGGVLWVAALALRWLGARLRGA